MKKSWAILMSGWGRSVVKTLELVEENNLPGTDIKLIVYENEENGVKEFAGKLNITTVCLPKSKFSDSKDYYKELFNILDNYGIQYLFLMGYKHIVREPMLSRYSDRILNIHPSLLPSFRGKRAIQQAMDYGVKISGLTTHTIDEEVDRGRIVCQRCIHLQEGESFEKLDQRFVEQGKKIIQDTFNIISEYE